MKLLFLCLALALPLSAADEIKPLDAALRDFPYPYEVKTLRIEDQAKQLDLAYMDLKPEKANGRSVLLLHGKNFSGAYWKPTADKLAAEGYRVIMPDQIGFGRSSKPVDYQYSFHAYGLHMRDLLDKLEVKRTLVAGHSMGGMVATRFALMFPERVEKLVLVNPIGLEDWKRFVPYTSVDANYAAELKKGPDAIRDYMTKAYFDGKWKAEYDPLLDLQAGWAVGPDREWIARVSAMTSDMVFTQPVVYEFGDLKVPTLLIIGERDRTAIGKERATPEVAKKLGQYQELGKEAAKAIPNAKLVALPGIGHVPQYEAFDDYWKALDGFIAEK
ncbi:alpha/beta fold hydrolase [Luteolibacter luteus]|uniref:Alpha/beta hydrolase n=1 Tax=Luteolibacter luteus TaxID=2728835 RepID=A0A858RJI0_9BACT|nr:alpha/beta hydrolase [Luteolibacter luteus]QJE96213.1 alpha/beta hydrolase [Luteolibacter luteus]